MPRSRKQVARFDPSPEVVASWNDTSGKARVRVELQARVRHGLASAEVAAASLAMATAATAAKEHRLQAAAKIVADADAAATAAAARAASSASPTRVPGPGRKRQRVAGAPRAGTLLPCDGPTWPPQISELRAAGRMERGGITDGDDDDYAGGAGSENPPATYSTPSYSTSGSDSDSSYSCASVVSNQNLPWRRPSSSGSAAAAVSITSSSSELVPAAIPSSASPASASGTDTDSEFCELLLVTGSSSSTESNSDGGSSSSSAPPPTAEQAEEGEEGRSFEGCTTSAVPDEEVEIHHRHHSKSRSRDEEGREDERRRTKKKQRRNVVTVRLARSKMPSRWATIPPNFETCLDDVRPEDRLGGDVGEGGAYGGDDAAAAAAASMLGLCDGDGVNAQSWLTSGFIDVVMAKFARTYPNVHFMPIDFAVLCLRGWGLDFSPPPSASSSNGSDDGHCGGEASSSAASAASAVIAASLADENMVFKDILGRPIVYSEKQPVIFLTHVNNVHWNLLRVEHDPVPELQLFEPMGKPPRRQGGSRKRPGAVGPAPSVSRGTGFRCIPKEVYRWLDAVWPLRSVVDGGGSSSSSGGSPGRSAKRKVPSQAPSHEGWASCAYSAITRQQQTTGFDCGVASLLYAEKCGQGQMREDVDAWTTQEDMTEYRRALQRYVEEVLRRANNTNTDASSSSSNSPGTTIEDAASTASTPPPTPPPTPPLSTASPSEESEMFLSMSFSSEQQRQVTKTSAVMTPVTVSPTSFAPTVTDVTSTTTATPPAAAMPVPPPTAAAAAACDSPP